MQKITRKRTAEEVEKESKHLLKKCRIAYSGLQ